MRRLNGVQSVPLYFNMLRGNFFFIQRILPNNSHAWKRANSYKVNNVKTQKKRALENMPAFCADSPAWCVQRELPRMWRLEIPRPTGIC